MVQSKWWKIL